MLLSQTQSHLESSIRTTADAANELSTRVASHDERYADERRAVQDLVAQSRSLQDALHAAQSQISDLMRRDTSANRCARLVLHFYECCSVRSTGRSCSSYWSC